MASNIRNRVVRLEDARRKRNRNPARSAITFMAEGGVEQVAQGCAVLLPEKAKTIEDWCRWVKEQGLAGEGQEETQGPTLH